MTREELIQSIKNATTPIDFDGLIAAGVIAKKGAWYEILKWNELPEHVKAKIVAAKTGPPVLVKFSAPSKQLAKFLEKEGA